MNKKLFMMVIVMLTCITGTLFSATWLDLSFNWLGSQPGTTALAIPFGARSYSIARQPDGKIVVAGSQGGGDKMAVARFNEDGTLDTTFNGTGYTVFVIGTASEARSVAIQSDGKIVVAGWAYVAAFSRFAVVRLNDDGTFDTATFGGGTGYATVAIGTSSAGYSVALQSDGKIVVAGTSDNKFAVARFDGSGTLDTATFGGGAGYATVFVGAGSSGNQSVVIQSDGKIVIAGDGGGQFAVVRFDGSGTLDTATFGGGAGYVLLVIGDFARSSSVAVQSDGKIIAAGYASIGGAVYFVAARFHGDGTLDTATFGGGAGYATVSIGDASESEGVSAVLQPDGKIVMAGYASLAGLYQFAVARFTTSGILDTTFNPDGSQPGTITTTIDSTGTHSYGNSVMLQPDGKIVVAGYTSVDEVDEFAVARFLVGATCCLNFWELAVAWR